MKKRLLLSVLLLSAILALCACAAKEPAADAAEPVQQAQGQVPPMEQAQVEASQQVSAAVSLPENYNPAGEEDGAPAFAAVNKVYAGATPVPIDPIDMPTATPRPELTFTYGDYTASKLGITFKSAVGYEINENLNDKYILTEPATAVKDNYPCTITLEVTGITKTFSTADVKTALARYLANEGTQYETWETMQPASKTLMEGKGYYNNYRGVLADGTIVRGRVHMAIINDSQMLTLHLSCPGWYNSSYMKIFEQIQKSIKPIQ